MYNGEMVKKKRKRQRIPPEYQLNKYLICRVSQSFLDQLDELADLHSSREGKSISGPVLARRILSEVVPERIEELRAGRPDREGEALPVLPPSAQGPEDDSFSLPLLDPRR